MGDSRMEHWSMMRLFFSLAIVTLIMAKPSQAGYHPHLPTHQMMMAAGIHQPTSQMMVAGMEQDRYASNKQLKRPVAAALRDPKPFIDEVALKSDEGPFWRALNQLLATYLRGNEAKKRATSASVTRTARTVPEDYMILMKIRSSPSNGN